MERNVKFPSSQTETGQYIAESATANEDHHEDTKLYPTKYLTSFQINEAFIFLLTFDLFLDKLSTSIVPIVNFRVFIRRWELCIIIRDVQMRAVTV